MSNTPHTYTQQCLGKWHAGFQIGNQSFVLSCFDGTEEEAEWYAKMMDKAFAAARAKDAELIQMLVDALEDSRVELCSAIPHLPGIGVKLATSQEAQCRASLAAAEAAGFKPSDSTN